MVHTTVLIRAILGLRPILVEQKSACINMTVLDDATAAVIAIAFKAQTALLSSLSYKWNLQNQAEGHRQQQQQARV